MKNASLFSICLDNDARAARLRPACLAALVVGSTAFANPCPPSPPPLPTPPYATLTGSAVVTGDTIDAGTINTCAINGGTLEVAGTLTVSGMLLLSPGGGQLIVDSGGLLSNAPGAQFLAVAGSISNAGAISNAGIFDPTAPLSNAGSISNGAGGQFIEIGAMTNSGTVSNDADFRITGPVGFVSSLANSGTVNNNASGSFSVILNASLDNSASFNNLGSFHSTGAITNEAGGQFTNSGPFVNGDPAGAVIATLTNAGSFLNSGGAASFSNSTGSTFTNPGTLDNAATATFANAGTLTSSGTLRNQSSFINTGSVANTAGVLSNSGATTVFTNGGQLTNSGAAQVNNGLGATLNNAAILNVAGGTLNNGATLNNQTLGSIAITGALLNVNGTLNNASGATITAPGILENSSTTIAGSTGVIDNHGSLTAAGTFTNHNGGSLTNEGDGTLQTQGPGTFTNEAGATVDHSGTWTNSGLVTNAGTIRVTGNLTGAGTYEQTAGLTKMLGGTIQQAQINIRGGQLLGAGTLTGSVLVTAAGTIGPGDPNTLTINGPLTVAGNLLVQIAGNGAGQFDVVKVVGASANLTGGKITFQFLSGYVPAAGSVFKGFLAADGGVTGLSGVTYAFLGLAQTPTFQVVADGTGFDLQIQSGTSGSGTSLVPIAGPDATYGNPGLRPDVFAMDQKGQVSVSMTLPGSNGDSILRGDGSSAAALLYQVSNPSPVTCGSAPVASGVPTYLQGTGGVLSTNASGLVGFPGLIYCGYPNGLGTDGAWLLDPAAAITPVANPQASDSLTSNPIGLAMGISGSVAGSPSDMSNINAGGAAAISYFDASGIIAQSPSLSVVSPAGTAVGFAFDADVASASARTHLSLNDAGNVIAGYNITATPAGNGAYLAYFDPRVSRATATQGTVDNLHLLLGPTLNWPLAGSSGPVLNNRGYAGLLLEDSDPAGQYRVALAALDPTLPGSPSVTTLLQAGAAGTGNLGGRFCGTAAINGFNQVVLASGAGPALAPGATGACGQALWLLDASGFTPQRIAAAGDSFAFGGQTWTIQGLAATSQQSINDAGQVAFGATASAAGTTASFILRYDPPVGTTPGSPILPANLNPASPPPAPWSLVVPNALTQPVPSTDCVGPPLLAGSSVNSALQCQRVIYLDPTLANGYQYQASAGAPNFAGVIVPAPLASGTSTFVVHYGTQTATVQAGQFLDFTQLVPGGAASFAITGLSAADALDAANPAAFVTGVVFAGPSSTDITVTMTPLAGTGPTITPNVAGNLGANGWYIGDVTVSFTVDATALSTTGCASVTVTADTPAKAITCTATNAAATTNSTVTIKRDATPPVVSNVPTGVTVTATSASGATVAYTAPTASDATSGLATGGGCLPASGSAFPVGATTVICTFSDLAGNSTSASFVVTVLLPAPPTIASSATGKQGSNGWYTGDVTVAFTVTGATSQSAGCNTATLTTDTAATTYTCSATNLGGTTTAAVTVKRDATAPVISGVPAGITATATSSSGAVVTYAAPTATDATAGVAAGGGCSPASGSTFPIATTTVTCSFTDNAGNAASASFTVTVTSPTSPPTVTPAVSGTLGSNGWYTGNVSVGFTVTGATSTSGCAAVTLATDTAGTTFTCSATNAGGTTNAQVTVKRDATAPTLASIGTVNAATSSASGAAVSYPSPAASDALSGLSGAGVSCAPASGSLFPVGTTTVTCTASDNAGNAATSTGQVTVTLQTACRDESLSVRPATTKKGEDLHVSAQIHNCAASAQSLSEQFTLSGPFGSGCATASEVLGTTPAIRLAPGATRNIGFDTRVPRTACRGAYTVTATTRSGGTAIDSASAGFTVK